MDLSREVEAYGLVETSDRGTPILTFHKNGNKAMKTLKVLEAKLGYSLIEEYHREQDTNSSNVFQYIKSRMSILLEEDKVEDIDKTLNKIILGNMNTILINNYKDNNLYPVYNGKGNLTSFKVNTNV